VALLIGGVLGIGGTWVAGLTRGDKGEASQDQRATPGGSPAAPSAAPTTPARPSASTPAKVNNAIAPRLTAITVVNGTSVLLRWQDRSRGRAQFIVLRDPRDGSDPYALGEQALPEGTTQFRVDGLKPETAPYCFHVIAIAGQETAASNMLCQEATG
jgi:hypothetical protein